MDDTKRVLGETAAKDGSVALGILSWLFGVVAFAIGVVNTFWGNDPGFGVFILFLSFIYFLPVNKMLMRAAGFSIPKVGIVKVLLGLFILWAAVGVGELFDKIELMVSYFK